MTDTEIRAGVVIKRDGKYLLIQEKGGPHPGQWSIPIGRIKQGHSPEETAIREAKEEAGFEVQLIRKIQIDYEYYFYEARITGGSGKFDKNDVIQTRWYTLDEIKELEKAGDLRDSWVLLAIENL